MHISEAEKTRLSSGERQTLRGRGNHSGSALGKTAFFSADVKPSHTSLLQSKNEEEIYFSAHRAVSEKLRRIYGELRSDNRAAWIFLMQITLLDGHLFTEIPRLYLSQGKNAAETVLLCKDYFYSVICQKDGGENLEVLYTHIENIAFELLCAIYSKSAENVRPQTILLCPTPIPSYIAENKDSLVGIVTNENPAKSHTSELAASFEIPYVATEEELSYNNADKNALINSDRGCLYINPDLETLTHFTDLDKQRKNEKKKEHEITSGPVLTKEGKHILVFAEINKASELNSFSERNCDGIGKFSSEELCLETMYPPDEEELFEEYRRAAEIMPTKPIIIRALKTSRSVHLSSVITEENDNNHGELYVLYDGTLRTQLRAVMRAAVYGSLQFVIHDSMRYSDLFQCAQMMEELSSELYEEDREFTPVPLGIAIDSLPCAIMCEKLIDECDFFVVDREKLSSALRSEKDVAYIYDRDDMYFDALDNLTVSIARAVTKKRKKAILSLGKADSLSELSLRVINEFSAISVAAQKLSPLKKKITQM